MSVERFRSHFQPDLFLEQHIAQVAEAARGICNWHSRTLMSEELEGLCLRLPPLHDLGKGSRAFQEYISSPDSYEGADLEKSHAPLSLMLTLAIAVRDKWDPLETLLISAAVYGHHKGFPTIPGQDAGAGEKGTLDRFAGGRMFKVLRNQIRELDVQGLSQTVGISIPSPSDKTAKETKAFLVKIVFPALRKLSIDEATAFRLKAQLVFSVLLEADKAFLAVGKPAAYLERTQKLWQSEWIEKKIGAPPDTNLNRLRAKAADTVSKSIVKNKSRPLQSLTAPTGLGKTLLAAKWALKTRELCHSKDTPPPKVIVVLPFLSIIEQTAETYRKLLSLGSRELDGSWFLTCHSLSDRYYDAELPDNAAEFFIDTWRTELVITTYDQFLMALADPRVKHMMRFHCLCDALVVLDEVQSLPCRMWNLLNGIFTQHGQCCNTRFLLMSATLPPFVDAAEPLLENYEEFFRFSRYKMAFHLSEKQGLHDFAENLCRRAPNWAESEERVLITLNTRKSAQIVFDSLKKQWPEDAPRLPMFFISSDVTPKDRLEKIETIKNGKPCIVVSTQCIEAGVDIDMSLVFRDFAPWDSLVQIAGRCNREGLRGDGLPVEIVDLTDDRGNRFSDMIYDDVHLAKTREVIGKRSSLGEKETLEVSKAYFEMLDRSKDTGMTHLERFAFWEDDIPIRELLRGKQQKSEEFLVIEQDPALLDDMRVAKEIEDRWERRKKWRKLAGRIANISVSVLARPDFKPEHIADRMCFHWVLKAGYYDSERGLRLGSLYADEDNVSMVF